jgi:hypothetical protein
MNKLERAQIADLSKLVFGSRTAWKKILEKGMLEHQTRTVDEVVPGKNGEPDTTRQVQVAVTQGKTPIKTTRYFTESQLVAYMVDRKEQFEKMMAQFKQQQAEAQAAGQAAKEARRLEQEVHNHATGSAV